MEILNFALIGAGKFGKNYLRLLQNTKGVSLKAIVTRSSFLNQDSSISPSILCVTDLKSILNDSSIDCVVIATPPATHFEIAKLAVIHKKHVLIEKPMVLNTQDAENLKRMVENSDRIFMVGFQYLFNNYIGYLQKEIGNGSFGALQEIKVKHFSSPKREDVNCFWDVVPHALSIFQLFFNPTKVIEVKGELKRIGKRSQEDCAAATIRFDRGPLLSIAAAWLGKEKIRKITFVGKKRTATLDETKTNNKLAVIENKNKSQSIPLIFSSEPLKNELEHFIHCVKTGRKPLADISFGYAITKWLEEISQKINLS